MCKRVLKSKKLCFWNISFLSNLNTILVCRLLGYCLINGHHMNDMNDMSELIRTDNVIDLMRMEINKWASHELYDVTYSSQVVFWMREIDEFIWSERVISITIRIIKSFLVTLKGSLQCLFDLCMEE